MTTRPTIEDLEPGSSVELLAVLRDLSMRTTKAGKPYLVITLTDRTGEIQARAWDEAEQLRALVSPGDAVVVKGLVETFGEQLQFKLRTMSPHPWDEDTRRILLPASLRDIDEMWGELCAGISEITDPGLRSFLESFVESDPIRSGFRTAPAAKVVHHAWVGGLLEHTVSMLAAAQLLADHYAPQVPALDRNLLIAGVVLHDVGKLVELGGEGGGMDYTSRGRFIGHMGLAVQMLERHRAAGHSLPEETLDRLIHLILSHHGDKEKGSPVTPVTVEAHLLHHVDMLDSRMAMAAKLVKSAGADGWTQYDRFLGGALYVGTASERSSARGECRDAPPTDPSREPATVAPTDPSREPATVAPAKPPEKPKKPSLF